MKQRLTQQQIQKLVPLQLMVARLSALRQSDLERAILEEVEKNPLLEIADEKIDKPELEILPGTAGQAWSGAFGAPGKSFAANTDFPEIQQAQKLDFFDQLLIQVRESGLSDPDIIIAEEIVGNLNEAGFLSDTPLENIAYKLSVPPDAVERVLTHIRKLGPPGIAARDLRECMLLQIGDGPEAPFVRQIIEEHFKDFTEARFDRIRKALGLNEAQMEYARMQIARLNPRPAAGRDDFVRYSIIPDLILREKNGELYIALNETGAPGLQLAETYLEMLNKKDTDRRTLQYLNRYRQEADWFIRAIEQRKQSMLAVGQSIVRRQREFLTAKREHPLPMVMREVAADTGLDISTVSRIVNGKYMQTPNGNYELRYFFSERAGKQDGLQRSTRDLEGDLRKLIEAENKAQALSDEELQAALASAGYHIARRTVAKYREKLGIPPSHTRRKGQ
ncbi:MAG: RNA polymerase factor sigma-54 [Candidatus Neomarinimicrobiota bacterium]|jgi:RNA polymerase sigma-54 factor|nr:RNA polymerase factor sigma-54 [Candidatus Neomarinimicrobiota bacterium]MDD3965490.1 RNA polymerase factor sigma-54 [Candidatus Neomarinimicrobiota bacterium]MDX9780159.1 RNA polymerase factor sigma-54 [bacterium]